MGYQSWSTAGSQARLASPVLYSAQSMTHLVEELGAFFAGFDDDTPGRLEAEAAQPPATSRRKKTTYAAASDGSA